METPGMLTLNLTPQSQKALVEEVGTGPETPADVKQWTADNDLTPITIARLAAGGFVTMKSMRLIKDSHITTLEIQPIAQCCLLEEAVKNLQLTIKSSTENNQSPQQALLKETERRPSDEPQQLASETDATRATVDNNAADTGSLLQQLLNPACGQPNAAPAGTTPLQSLLNSLIKSQTLANSNDTVNQPRADLDPKVYMQTKSKDHQLKQLESELDLEIAFYRGHTFAQSTKTTYAVHRKAYLEFVFLLATVLFQLTPSSCVGMWSILLGA
ncbi:uncharacterized protein [Ptychodera flava]|uniref:uncharacterized protein n=1 Tax=Ptychodera flava TaxID=63121 RepID=UPI003969C265